MQEKRERERKKYNIEQANEWKIKDDTRNHCLTLFVSCISNLNTVIIYYHLITNVYTYNSKRSEKNCLISNCIEKRKRIVCFFAAASQKP